MKVPEIITNIHWGKPIHYNMNARNILQKESKYGNPLHFLPKLFLDNNVDLLKLILS
jgi:hypothetical protein